MQDGATLMQLVQERLASSDPLARAEGLLATLALPDELAAERFLHAAVRSEKDRALRDLASRALALFDQRTDGADPDLESGGAPGPLVARIQLSLADPRPSVRLAALSTVLRHGGRWSLPLVGEALKRESTPQVLVAMASFIGQLGSEVHLHYPVNLLAHPDPRVAAAAESALANLGGESVAPLFELAKHCRREARAGTERVRHARDHERLAIAFRRLITRKEPDLRLRAVLLVRRAGCRALLTLILDHLAVETAPRVIAAMLLAIAELGGAAEVGLLSPYLCHGNHRVVKAAILALHRLGGDDVLPLFLPLLTHDDPRVRAQSLVAVLKMDPTELLRYARRMAASPRTHVRARALTCLRVMSAIEVEDILMAMLEREQVDVLRAREAELLADRVTPASVGMLCALKASRPDLAAEIDGAIGALSLRSGVEPAEFESRGSGFARRHQDMVVSRELAVLAGFELPGALARPCPTAPLRPVHPPRPPPPRRGIVAACLIAAAFGLSLLGEPAAAAGDLPGWEQRAMERLEAAAAPARAEPLPDLPPVASAPEALEARAAAFLPAPPRMSDAEVVAWHAAFLVRAGFDSKDYIRIEAQGQVRAGYDRAIAEAARQLSNRDPAGAVVTLVDALEATDPENWLARRDLNRELAAALVRAGRLDDARLAALAAHELAVKIVCVYRRARRPGTSGFMATDEEVARTVGYRARIEADYRRAKAGGTARPDVVSADGRGGAG